MKIVLDTNVYSQLIHPQGSAIVRQWVDSRDRAAMYLTSVTQAEILFGIRRLPQGRRRDALLASALEAFGSDLVAQILPFDSIAAEWYAEIMASRERAGRPMSQFDAQIAAICRARGAVLATRNVKDFVECGVEVANPWG